MFCLKLVFLSWATSAGSVNPDCDSDGCPDVGNQFTQVLTQRRKVTDPDAVPSGYVGPTGGYCKTWHHFQKGLMNMPHSLGGVQQADSVQACADLCTQWASEIYGYRDVPCRGFNYAPGVHNECHLFPDLPAGGDGQWGWKCYVRDTMLEINLGTAEHVSSGDFHLGRAHGQIIGARWHRPEWSKTLRCKGTTCEECAGSDACWSKLQTPTTRNRMSDGQYIGYLDGKDGRELKYDGTGGWTNFTNVIHVRCPTNAKLYFKYTVKFVKNGRLDFFWDGHNISIPNGFNVTPLAHYYESWQKIGNKNYGPWIVGADSLTIYKDYNYSTLEPLPGKFLPLPGNYEETGNNQPEGMAKAELYVNNSGGHELEIVFTPYSQSDSGAFLQSIQFHTDMAYANCEDAKMCTELLDGDDIDHQRLRSINSVQYSCLLKANPSIDSACGKWRDCLTDSAEADLRELFSATGVPLPPSVPALLQELQGEAISYRKAKSSTCFAPELENAHAWACDCLDGMKTVCDARLEQSGHQYSTMPECLTDLICENAEERKICPSWVDENCGGTSLLTRATATLNDSDRSASHSARSGDEHRVRDTKSAASSDKSFDESLRNKACV